MSQRRPYSSKEKHDDDAVKAGANGTVDHEHHEHSHSLFSHPHSHDDESRTYGVGKVIEALQGGGDRGSRVTLIGLFSNVALTGVKGVAGWYLHSASLLADAGHSLSDLLGDFVTLFCWRLSRKPPSETYPYGFAKFETVGTSTVSLLLIGGAVGIGFHSYHLLHTTLTEAASTLPTGPLQEILYNVTTVAPPAPTIVAQHSEVEIVDPQAAWFAALGILTKEWLYRITKTVADAENSPVLLANAIHHRSDAYSSLVALFAIVGSWLFPALPLDPIGGLIVSFVILKQGIDLLAGAWGDLTDASISKQTQQSIIRIIQPILKESGQLQISHLRGRRAGSLVYVDLQIDVPSSWTIQDISAIEQKVVDSLKHEKKEVAEVSLKFKPVSNSTE